METSSKDNSYTVSEGGDSKKSYTPNQESEIEQLNNRIHKLHMELTKLRGELASILLDTPQNEPAIPRAELDEDLQKQVLALTEAMPHMVWIADSEGKTMHANKRFHEFSGLDENSDDGFAWITNLHPEDLEKAIRLGNEAALSNSPFSMEVRCLDKEGKYRWHLMPSIPFFDPSSQSTKWFGTTTCIDEQISAREELKHSEYKFRTLADAIPQIVFIADANGMVQFWNHRFYEFSGFTEEQGRIDAWQLLIHEKDRDAYLEGWENAVDSGDTFETEFRLKRALHRKANTEIKHLWHLARAVALRDINGEIECWFGTWTDINIQKREE
ncbi:MAG TPA: PAS domain-containing protein [Candidatus Melainabacteria bacterium]|nr:PAS domain-containing protein [Candidatus Melainabacteria bacterium]